MRASWRWWIVTAILVAAGFALTLWSRYQRETPRSAGPPSALLKVQTPWQSKSDPKLEILAPQTTRLPVCDRAELFIWKNVGTESVNQAMNPADPVCVLTGQAAEDVAALWREQSLDCRPLATAMCHQPIFGVRLHPLGGPALEISLCWECENFFFVEKGRRRDGCSFAPSSNAAKVLRAKFEAIFPAVTAHLPNYQSLSASEVPSNGLDRARQNPCSFVSASELTDRVRSNSPAKPLGHPSILPGIPEVHGPLRKVLINRIVNRHIKELAFCYESGLTLAPNLQGRVVVQFSITEEGQVMRSTVQSSTMGNLPVEQCIANALRRWSFPRSQGGIVVVTYPFTLHLKKSK